MRRILLALAVASLLAVMAASSAAAKAHQTKPKVHRSVVAPQATSLGSFPSKLC